MALTNANQQCKAAILSLPMDLAPTLDDMLHVCTQKVPFMVHTLITVPEMHSDHRKELLLQSTCPLCLCQSHHPKEEQHTVPENSTAFWAEIVDHDILIICGLFNKGDKVFLLGLVDTGENVKVIAHSKRLDKWELVPANGIISGIGGPAMSMRSKRTILIEGLKGQMQQ
ncbi:hypothetical protein DUI87_30780 [Hirundo rustica rustica]|uniref:Peptidase A2 domain-containing protein n=1 Tax=Hirundo rustica rustica TaxID=333673 RepID=A0A3M0JDU0_HIRRU|nr:hypothetical protein DUI87_30780 [Hirundo rustica rustica]